MDENKQELTKKERRALKRAERENQQGYTEKKERTRKVIATVVILILLAAFVWLFWPGTTSEVGLGEDRSREIAYQGADHIEIGSPHDAYNSNPPTSGPHWPEPVRDGIYDRSQPDEGLVHSLEHGRIWISYKSSIPDSVKQQIKEFADKQFRVVITVREGNEMDIAVAAWQRLDTFNVSSEGTIDMKRIEDFTKRYRDKGPEYVPAMTGRVYD